MKALAHSSPLSFNSAATLVAAASAVGVLLGCGATPFDTSRPVGTALTGRVVGGQQAIQNAAIYLYAAGATGDGTGASNLLTKSVYTAADGSFSITGDYTCPGAITQVYLVGFGGNPGISASASNSASVLMAPLGDCGNLSASSYAYIDEVTTAASAWALAQFLGPNADIGASATNSTGLRNAFLIANNLVNTATGLAGGSALPAGATIESAKLYTLANALAVCVNSNGGAACAPLFSAATANGVTPANTLDAALSIVRHPANNVAAVFRATSASPPFPYGLTHAPNDWTMTIAYTGSGLASPTSVAVDSQGNVWAANYTYSIGGTAAKLAANGVPASTTGFAAPNLYESYAIAVDTQDSAWIVNEESHGAVNSGFGSLTKFSSSGQVLSGSGFTSSIYYPYGIAADSNGDIWVADEGHSQVSLLDNNGNSLIGPNGYSSYAVPLPLAVAIDASHNAWFAGEASASKVTPGGAITEYSCCIEASAIAIDQNGSIWVSDYTGSSSPASAVVQLSSAGAVLQRLTTGGVYYPEGIAIDGAGAVWVANYHGDTISGFSAAANGAPSAALSPSSGFGLDAGLASPFGIALDASGDIWVANFAGASLTQFVGLASPVRTPLLGPPTQP